MPKNLLYYGDNLDVLRRHGKDESVDLVYLDPPFNSARNYNVLFAEQDGSRAAAQIKAFEDTWEWNEQSSATYHAVVESGGKVSEVLQALRMIVGDSDMLAYLAMMAPRLVELRRVLKPTGSLYLHCDPTAARYLNVLLDGVFGPENFRSEIIWKRSSAHSDTKQGRKIHGHIHDTILFYTKSDEWTWNPIYSPYDEEYVEAFYSHVEDGTGRRYQLDNLTAAKPGGDVSYEFHGTKPYKGRYWAYSRENMEQFYREGRLHFPANGGTPRYKRYLDEMPGVPLQDVWTDIRPIGAQAAERLGYPTQKPEALLERIIACSSNEGDVVLDPFCGCGTAVAAAENLKRRWIGIDITHLAVALIKNRLRTAFGDRAEYEVLGEPVSLDDAEELAASDPYQFQWWALGLVGARPAEQKKGADRGIDGRLYFRDGMPGDKTRQIILSVKAGHVTTSQVRDLVGVLDREKAAIGVLISFEKPTKPMEREAASAGVFETAWGSHPRVQLLTVGELLEGKQINAPRTAGTNVTYKAAPKVTPKLALQHDAFDVD
ncbi:MAG: site-specific DNA-methyltransferase [Gemmatimonadota bacterium]|nr:site-specific DNA-methyltransferase [Gemmatimonadota bacterium]